MSRVFGSMRYFGFLLSLLKINLLSKKAAPESRGGPLPENIEKHYSGILMITDAFYLCAFFLLTARGVTIPAVPRSVSNIQRAILESSPVFELSEVADTLTVWIMGLS